MNSDYPQDVAPVTDVPTVEPATVNVRLPVFMALGLALMMVISFAITGGIYVSLAGWNVAEQQEAKGHVETAQLTSTYAPLSANQREEREAYDAQQQELLETWGWIDRKDGIARMPIEVAMQRLIENGGKAP